jgi:hypothetical protein
MQEPIDGLRPEAPAKLGRLVREQRISTEFVRHGGKGHYAGVTLLAKPSNIFHFESLPNAWQNSVEKEEYEPRLAQGVLDALMNIFESEMLGVSIVLEKAVATTLPSEFAFYSAGRLAAFRLVSETHEGAGGWSVTD